MAMDPNELAGQQQASTPPPAAPETPQGIQEGTAGGQPQRPKTIMIKRPGQAGGAKPLPTQKLPKPPAPTAAPGQPPSDEAIFGAQTMAVDAGQSGGGAQPGEPPAPGERPKTIMIKRPSGSTARTVKTARPVQEGTLASAKSSTSKVDLPEGVEEPPVTSHRQRTVKIKRPNEVGTSGASTLAVERAARQVGATVGGVAYEQEQTGPEGPGVFFTVLTILSLIIALGAIYVLCGTIWPEVPLPNRLVL